MLAATDRRQACCDIAASSDLPPACVRQSSRHLLLPEGHKTLCEGGHTGLDGGKCVPAYRPCGPTCRTEMVMSSGTRRPLAHDLLQLPAERRIGLCRLRSQQVSCT